MDHHLPAWQYIKNLRLERVTFNRIHLTRSNLFFCPHVRTAKPVPTLAEHALKSVRAFERLILPHQLGQFSTQTRGLTHHGGLEGRGIFNHVNARRPYGSQDRIVARKEVVEAI